MTPRAEPCAQRQRPAEKKVQRAKHPAPDGYSQAFSHIGTCPAGFQACWGLVTPLSFLPPFGSGAVYSMPLQHCILEYTIQFLAHRSTNWDGFHPSVDRMQNLTYTWYRQLRWDVGLRMRFRWDFGLSVVAVRLLGMLGEANVFCTRQTRISEGRWQCTEVAPKKCTEVAPKTDRSRESYFWKQGLCSCNLVKILEMRSS